MSATVGERRTRVKVDSRPLVGPWGEECSNGRTPRIRKVAIRNYKSLAEVGVELGRLTVFIGPNGSGRGNVVDAPRFVRNVLNVGLRHGDRPTLGHLAGLPRRKRIARDRTSCGFPSEETVMNTAQSGSQGCDADSTEIPTGDDAGCERSILGDCVLPGERSRPPSGVLPHSSAHLGTIPPVGPKVWPFDGSVRGTATGIRVHERRWPRTPTNEMGDDLCERSLFLAFSAVQLQMCSKATRRSSMMSCQSSRPTESRIAPGSRPL